MTRIGLIADIHGNLVALDQVIRALDAESIDEIICLGDVAVLGPQPDEVINLLRKREVPTVCGNTDAWLIGRHVVPAAPPDSSSSRTYVDWTRTALSPANLDWIRRLPLTINRKSADIMFCFCHGSPVHSDDIITNMAPERVGEFGYDVIVGGHTHQQTERVFGAVRYVNPGSAGLPGVGPGDGVPVHERPTWIEFGVLDIEADDVEVEFHRVEADLERILRVAQESGMPELEWWKPLWGLQ